MNQIVFIHVGKTGGITIRNIFGKNGIKQLIDTEHVGFKLNKNCDYEHILISIRDPVSRFVSAFNWRKINKRKKLISQNKKKELRLLDHFKVPNNLAEALSSSDQKEKQMAIDAMKTIGHINKPLDKYVSGVETLKHLYNSGTKFYVINTNNLSLDTKNCLEKVMQNSYNKTYEISTDVPYTNVSTKSKDSVYISDFGRKNLQEWYANDYTCIDYLNSIKET